MPGETIRADYEELAQIASLWKRESDAVGQTVSALRREMAVLEGGDWVGQGARAFYAEMNGSVLPSVVRLGAALGEAAQVSAKISALVQQAEDAAAAVLRGPGTGGDAKLPAMGVTADQVQPKASNIGATLGGILGGIFGGAAGAAAGAKAGSMFDHPGGTFVPLADAPKTLDVPKPLNDGLADAWKDSFPGGHSQEQGGMLVQDKDGNLVFRRGASGSSGAFTPNYGDLKDGDTLIALVHTHPYDATEGGHTDVSFSGPDIANLVNRRDPMKMVQSGDGQFAVLRTQEFDRRVNGLDNAGKQALYDQMKADYDTTFNANADTLSFSERSQRAAEAVAKKYDLAYYQGKDGALTRKTP
ncbi:MAG: WXG100 family type VII secretion target [Thermoflexales bacterium]|nr:WXG100 family type VII secretion target [Thermoflexales bacterium]